MSRLKCIAVDDEPLALDLIQDYIDKVPFLEFIARFESPLEAMAYLHDNQVDLLFLDIQMEELSGIKLLNTLKIKPQVILTTAYASFALEGYELDVTDYLLKPISFDRFLRASNKAFEKFRLIRGNKESQENEMVISNPRNDYFFVKTEYRLQKINFADILFVEGQGDYLKIYTPKENIMTLQNFKRMEEILPAFNFIRVHRSYIIALDKIENVVRQHLTIAGHIIPIGDTYKEEFFALLQKKGLF
jgi:two-component system, LytTR family, response regulator